MKVLREEYYLLKCLNMDKDWEWKKNGGLMES